MLSKPQAKLQHCYTLYIKTTDCFCNSNLANETRRVLIGQIPAQQQQPWVIDNNCMRHYQNQSCLWKLMAQTNDNLWDMDNKIVWSMKGYDLETNFCYMWPWPSNMTFELSARLCIFQIIAHPWVRNIQHGSKELLPWHKFWLCHNVLPWFTRYDLQPR